MTKGWGGGGGAICVDNVIKVGTGLGLWPAFLFEFV